MPDVCPKCGVEAVEDGVCESCGAGSPEGADVTAFTDNVALDLLTMRPDQWRAHVACRETPHCQSGHAVAMRLEAEAQAKKLLETNSVALVAASAVIEAENVKLRQQVDYLLSLTKYKHIDDEELRVRWSLLFDGQD